MSVGWLVGRVRHSFDDPHVAPYWPTWPCSHLGPFCAGQVNGNQMRSALNSLRSVSPDNVSVTHKKPTSTKKDKSGKTDVVTEHFTITFNSKRGKNRPKGLFLLVFFCLSSRIASCHNPSSCSCASLFFVTQKVYFVTEWNKNGVCLVVILSELPPILIVHETMTFFIVKVHLNVSKLNLTKRNLSAKPP